MFTHSRRPPARGAVGVGRRRAGTTTGAVYRTSWATGTAPTAARRNRSHAAAVSPGSAQAVDRRAAAQSASAAARSRRTCSISPWK